MFVVKKNSENDKDIIYEINFLLFLLCSFIIDGIFGPIWFLIFLTIIILKFLPIYKKLFNPELVQQLLIWSSFKLYIWEKRWTIEKYFRLSFKLKKPIIIVLTFLEIVENDKNTNTELKQDKQPEHWNIAESLKVNQDKELVYWNIAETSELNQNKQLEHANITETSQLYKDKELVYWNSLDNFKTKKIKLINSWFFYVSKRSPLPFTWLFLSVLTLIFWSHIPFAIYILLVMIALIIVGLFFKNKKEEAELQWKKPFNIETLIANLVFLLAFWQMIFIIFMLINKPEAISFFSN